MRGPKKATARVPVSKVSDEGVTSTRDTLAREEPLEIRISTPDPTGVPTDTPVAVTMRTPGHDFELAAGFLYSEGLIRDRRNVSEIRYCTGVDVQEYNVVTVALRGPAAAEVGDVRRNFYTTSSCGICGKASIDQVEAMVPACVVPPDRSLPDALVRDLPDRLRAKQHVFGATGGAHAAGVFDWDGNLRWLREDVGRHNAVDKVVGAAFLDSALPLADHILVVSGRASFELVQKAGAAGIPALVAVGAPSSLAAELANRLGITLIGFTRPSGFNVYAGEQRVTQTSVPVGG